MSRHYSANAQAITLATDITNSATTIQVSATTGWPAVDFVAALDYGTASQELVLVTGVSGTTWTVTRGLDSTTAVAHSAGAAIRHAHSSSDFALSRTHEDSTSGVHGRTGSLVGTTDAQALTNKDLSSGTNTFPASLATDAEVTSAVSTHAAVSSGVHGVAGSVVGTSDTQTLTNKTVSADNNTISGLAASSFAVTNASGNLDGAAAQKAIPAGDVVGTTDTQTLSNKTLAAPTVTGALSGASASFSGSVSATNIPTAMKFGQVSGTTDGNGDLTVTHGLGTTPTAALATLNSPSTNYIVGVGISSTTLTLRFRVANTGAPAASTGVPATAWVALA